MALDPSFIIAEEARCGLAGERQMNRSVLERQMRRSVLERQMRRSVLFGTSSASSAITSGCFDGFAAITYIAMGAWQAEAGSWLPAMGWNWLLAVVVAVVGGGVGRSAADVDRWMVKTIYFCRLCNFLNSQRKMFWSLSLVVKRYLLL